MISAAAEAKMAGTTILRRAIRQKLSTRCYSLEHHDPKQAEAARALWKNLTIFGIPIAIGLGAANIYLTHEHQPRPEFIPYDHLRIRTKRFPWGDGTRGLFHNPHVNALPDGYEVEEEH